MGISIIPKIFQNGTFTIFDISDINDEMYIAYIIYDASNQPNLNIDTSSYDGFLFEGEEGYNQIKEWFQENEDMINSIDVKYQEETNKYIALYNMYKEKDYWVKTRFPLLKTEISKIDLYIVKETLMQIIYTTSIYGSCTKKCDFHNISESIKNEVSYKLDEIFKAYNIYKNKLSEIDKEFKDSYSKIMGE